MYCVILVASVLTNIVTDVDIAAKMLCIFAVFGALVEIWYSFLKLICVSVGKIA